MSEGSGKFYYVCEGQVDGIFLCTKIRVFHIFSSVFHNSSVPHFHFFSFLGGENPTWSLRTQETVPDRDRCPRGYQISARLLQIQIFIFKGPLCQKQTRKSRNVRRVSSGVWAHSSGCTICQNYMFSGESTSLLQKAHTRRQPRNFENVTLAACRRKYFQGFWADFFVAELPQKRGRFNTQEFTRFLSPGVVSESSHALWRVLSNKVIWVLGHCWVENPHVHTSNRDFLIFDSRLLATVTVMPSDSDYVNRSASLQRFRLIHTSTIESTIFRIRTTGFMRTRQSPYAIVGDCSDEGKSLLCQGPRSRRE